MKTKDINALRSMDAAKLQAHADKLKSELARLQLDMRMQSVKNTNEVPAKKQELARVLTFLTEKTQKAQDTSSTESK